ncbi:uncharacterized protein LOC126304979 [Schistocerca gregaria]|uniref:uncharacterized protein LOC126304979 n=1 Tax=Schistocerca gregaria TaxID=7010 RepID=UPI00211DFBD4|nr:uncharacterized protein LOC126304979 [Schistocerca gregaria]
MNSFESALALLTLFLLIEFNTSLSEKEYTILIPTTELFNQSANFEESKIYRIDQLDPLEQYEIRVSWPCYSPVFITLQLVCANEDTDHSRNLTRINTREILNTEKFIFETNSNRQVLNCLDYEEISPEILKILDPKKLGQQETYLVLNAVPNSVASDGSVRQEEFSFNLVIEPLRIGLSIRAIKTAMYTILALILAVLAARVFLRRYRKMHPSKIKD